MKPNENVNPYFANETLYEINPIFIWHFSYLHHTIDDMNFDDLYCTLALRENIPDLVMSSEISII